MTGIVHEGAASATRADILGQVDAWAPAVAAVARSVDAVEDAFGRPTLRHVIAVGCGSPYFLAHTAATLWGAASGLATSAVPASELAWAPHALVPYPAASLLVAISRSGATTELLEAVGAFRAAGGSQVIAITCRSESRLAVAADLAIAIDDGYEPAVAQTRSFSSMLVAVEAIAAAIGGRPLASPDALWRSGGSALVRADEAVALVGDLATVDRIDYLGSGAHFGLAREAMLKVTELSLTHSSAYHFLEYRHGPKAMVDPATLVVGLVGGTDASAESAVLEEVVSLGGRTLAVEPDGTTLASMMPTLQLLALERTIARGLDPDHPRHLTAVVHLASDLRSERTDDPHVNRPEGEPP